MNFMTHTLKAGALLAMAWLSLMPGVRAATTLLKAAHVHTVSGGTLSPGSVLIREGKIVEVAKTIPGGADQTIDLGAQHLYPGLIAANVELGLVEIDSVRATVDTTEVGEFTPDVRAWIAINPDSEQIPVARANGITHAEVAPQGGVVAGQSGVFALSGWTWEDMVVKRPAGLHVYWPNMGLDTTSRDQTRDRARVEPLEEQAKARDRKLKALEDFFEEARAYVKSKPKSPVPAWEAMRPFVQGDAPVIVHADEVRQIKAAVAWGVTRGFRIVIADGRDAWKVASLLAEKKVPVIYDAVFKLPSQQIDPYDVHFKAPFILQQAGVQVAIASDSRSMNLRNLPYCAAHAMAFGLPPEEALQTITLNPATILGVADRLGSIEPGKDATMFVATGDILDIRSQVKRMWIFGREVNLESRHTRLYDKYRNRPKP